jgi:D-serine deaminase-like pyridoxal phosphate-dependent protein
MSFLQDVQRARDYVGKSLTDIPIPAFVLDRAQVRENSERMLARIRALGVKFRPHVNVFKAIPVVRQQVGKDHSRVAASSLEDIRNLLSLVEEGVVKDVLYCSPIGKSQVKELAYLRNLYWNLGAMLHILIDHPDQLDFILLLPTIASKAFRKWSIFICVDVESDEHSGETTEEFEQVLTLIALYPKYATKFSIVGFYCHAVSNHQALDTEAEISTVVEAARVARTILVPPPTDYSGFVLSIGASPTAHAMSPGLLGGIRLHSKDKLEIHTGNYLALDLQQVGISLADKQDIAGTVLAEICSYYAARNEYLVSAGMLALSSQKGPFPGYAHVHGHDDWLVTRVFEQHGIISYIGDEPVPIKLPWRIGDRVRLYPQNVAMTAACHKLYFIVDGKSSSPTEVVDIWTPWKYW